MRDLNEVATVIAQTEALGVQLDGAMAERLLRFESLLSERAVGVGLVSRSDAGRIRERHVLDSIRAAPWVGEGHVLDLGSGGGLPGIPVAIARPDIRMTLIESRARRAGFLELAARLLGPSNIEVVPARAQALSIRADACLARAFAPLPRAWEIASRLLRPGGRLVFFAGKAPDPEAIPEGARLEAVVRHPVLESAGPLVIMTRQ